MARFEITLFTGETMKLGPMTGRVGYAAGTFTADTRAQAVEQARAKLRQTPGWEEYADGRAESQQVYQYGITLRGKKDGRRRETFIVTARDERQALLKVSYIPGAYRFAGGQIQKRVNVVSISQV